MVSMKLGTTTIRSVVFGASSVRGGYIGTLGLGSLPDGPAYPLYDEVGDWATSSLAATVYTPALTGTVYDVVEDYGADPTGATNSREAIQNAITACGVAGGGTVYIPAGTYVAWPAAAYDPDTNPRPVAWEIHYPNVTIEGAGPTLTILSILAPGAADPNSEIMVRGGGFTTLGVPRNLSNVTFRGFRITGNAGVTSNAGAYSGEEGSLSGWDTNHKAFAIYSSAYTVTGFVWENVEVDHWRGEQIYSGGTGLGTFTIRESLLRQCNASSISMGGTILMEDCEQYAVLNATECFCTAGESFTARRCIIEPQRSMPEGLSSKGVFGLVHHGLSTASFLIEDCTFRGSNTAQIFLAEFANNGVIQNNVFEDVSIAIYGLYQGQYSTSPAVAESEWELYDNIQILNNTFHAKATNCGSVINSYTKPWSNVLIDGNEVIGTDGHTWNFFIWTRGATDGYTISNNDIQTGKPAHFGIQGPRPDAWTGNTINATFGDGEIFTSYLPASDPTPIDITPAWPMVQISAIGGTDTMQRELTVELESVFTGTTYTHFPTGFPLRIVRGGSSVGAEIKPDDWNDLTRGYMLYSGAELNLVMNAAGVFELVSYTAPTVNLRTHTEALGSERASAADIAFFGQLSVTLAPTVAHTFSTFSGVAIGETVTINVNANTTLDHVPGVLEMSNGVDYVSSGTVELSATRAADGALEVTIP